MKKCAAQNSGLVMLINQDFLSYKAFMERCHGKRPFRTSRGYVGLCDRDVEVGDVLGAVAGAVGLSIFRPVDVGKELGCNADTFSIKGEAYAYGLMDGELEHLEHVSERRFLVA